MKDWNDFLEKIRNGHDEDAAAAALGITKDEIEAGGDELTAATSEAYGVGTARLRSKVMEEALSDANSAVLLRLLEGREEKQKVLEARVYVEPMSAADWLRRVLFSAAELITKDPDEAAKIQAELCRFKCEHCGQMPYTYKGKVETPPFIPSGSI